MKYTLLLLISVLLSCAILKKSDTSKTTPTTTIYLVRHAEKATSKNPPLTKAGQQRAQDLEVLLKPLGITHIFSTNYLRTQQTAQPLADALKLKMDLYHPRKLEVFASLLKNIEGKILVSGHSNTTPALVTLLGGDSGDPIAEKWEFDRLYILELHEGKLLTSVMKKYGQPCQPPKTGNE